MRSFSHWTPRYLSARLQEKAYRSANPGLPWLTPEANQFLQGYLSPSDNGLEFGAGRSTVWLAPRIHTLTSVDHNPLWFKKVESMLAEKDIHNVTLLLRQRTEADGPEGETAPYTAVVETIAKASLDFVLVDGTYRAACALGAITCLKPGGVLILDNANIYLPCRSHSPNSRTEATGPLTPLWSSFLHATKTWRRYWTSNGVSDTAFFFKTL